MTMSTRPTPNMRIEAEVPTGPPAHGRQTTIPYQSQPSPMRLTAASTLTTQERVEAPCIQSTTRRSRSTQTRRRSGHDRDAGGGCFERIDGIQEARLEARQHFVPAGAARCGDGRRTHRRECLRRRKRKLAHRRDEGGFVARNDESAAQPVADVLRGGGAID